MRIEQSLSEKLQANSRITAANMPMAASLVETTGALAIVDPFTAEHAIRLGGVSARRLKQDMTYHIAVVTRGMDTLSREARQFSQNLIELIREHTANF